MKGLVVLLVMLAVAAVFCGIVPFVLMPGAGVGMALPAITVPGEVLWKDFLGIKGLDITNTIVGTLVTDIVVLLFAFGAVRGLKEVPGRLQGLFEVMTDALYSLAKSTAGANARKVFPLMATIFLFLLVANWIKLVPGAESVGLMHCAHEGINGYAKDGIILKVEDPLYPGEKATHADYEACYEAEHGGEHAEGVTEGNTETATGAESASADPARSDLHAVTPFLRGAATDLNLTLGLALLAFLAIQYFGVRALGIGYFAKFINLPALGNLDKRPMGLMDFAVGLLETLSEFAKIISFGFRLFGNIFAGSVLLFVISFLVATVLPSVFYGLELFIGLIQAFVFAMLLLVFSASAMQPHHGDEEHH